MPPLSQNTPRLHKKSRRAYNLHMLILAIESTCDETATALLKTTPQHHILAQHITPQTQHRRFGGVVPEIAARQHLANLPALLGQTLRGQPQPGAVAASCGPGLIGGLITGASAARALALAWQTPFLAVNHLAAHALSPRLAWPELKFPYLLLLASGGHCQTLAVSAHDKFRRYGQTLDDAPGEALDKAARLLGLGWPGGPALEKHAATFQPENPQQRRDALALLPDPLARRGDSDGDGTNLDFSFSGLKTALARKVNNSPAASVDTAALAFAFQERVMRSLARGAGRALARFRREHDADTPLLAAGGVAANRRLAALLSEVAARHGTEFLPLPAGLCTDNAAMVAHAAGERVRACGDGEPFPDDGFCTPLRPRWPLDAGAVAVA
ncbi:MAG: tRNA (adenosine(37)-N6)-threonylcarbamoyltransferase complex transferase subunit TsaD [Alphaproteobacteria bacterium]|nr:tRNA (adenosine(37)-N6)-threonylcarbamoyltransferase complex transferase subunit TsaD [Alphaproteobacteria bacterium]